MNDFNILNQPITPGISLITAVKNRTEYLQQSLETWLSFDEIDEIIIVDWSSDDSLIKFIERYQNDKIILVIATDQDKWIQTKAFNLSARFSSREKILKLDADIKLIKGFFDHHSLNPGFFYTGNWAIAKSSNDTHLNGSVYVFRNDFFEINGYNELFQYYGYDDTDLYNRLENNGLTRMDFNPDFMAHIEHENRIVNFFSDYISKLNDSQKADLSILMNRYFITESFHWDTSQPLTTFEVNSINPNIYICSQPVKNDKKLPEELVKKSELVAIKERLKLAGQEFSDQLFDIGTRNEIIDLFYIFHNRQENQTFENIYNLILRYDRAIMEEILRKEREINQLLEKIQLRDEQINSLTRKNDSIF